MFKATTRLSFFSCQKDAARAPLQRRFQLSAPVNKKIGSGSSWKVAAPAPQHLDLDDGDEDSEARETAQLSTAYHHHPHTPDYGTTLSDDSPAFF